MGAFALEPGHDTQNQTGRNPSQHDQHPTTRDEIHRRAIRLVHDRLGDRYGERADERCKLR